MSGLPSRAAEPARAPLPPEWIVPDWPAPTTVRAFVTTRSGGVSRGPWGAGALGGMNVGFGSGDSAESVARNRALLAARLPAPPRWLALQHGAGVVAAEEIGSEPAVADASTAITPEIVCCVTVADCLPVLLADRSGVVVAAAHAGWRGLAAGVLQATVQAMHERARASIGPIDAFLGPSIGPAAFEVGEEVLHAMLRTLPQADCAFAVLPNGKFLADLPALARQALAQVGVLSVFGGSWCTMTEPERFFSFRRDRITGRHAALIWLQPLV
ncbi:MAG: peptidoglycan editing factor PgeF [Burkholderiaceae bacterium]|nr:peptidoglycan editing factor PgeF [Burkholderiaceae bacterium]